MRPSQLIRQLESEIEIVDREVVAARQLNLDRTIEIRKLIRQQTGAFIDLSRHYLPDLTHQSIADAWIEVGERIRDLWLQKNDKRRGLKQQLVDAEANIEQLNHEFASLREQLEDAHRVLACKSGNYRKALREDAAIKSCNESIADIDTDIELCLTQLDLANQDAEKKLPNYEESSLFRYLHERQFGTPAYQARGLERRWDRWVAKLIDYRKARKNFEYLRSTPSHLQDLIDEKQARYRNLLKQLDHAQEAASTRFGVQEQTKVWQSLAEKVEQQEQAIEQARWKAACLQSDLYDLENVNGDFYREAIKIYREFLANLDPEILRVYAACTASPVDDEICARLRRIQQQIATEQNSVSDRNRAMTEREKYAASIRDLVDRLRAYVRKSAADVVFYVELDLADMLQRIERCDMTPDYAWRLIRGSMVQRPIQSDHNHDPEPKVSSVTPLQACYLAASDDASETVPGTQADLAGIVLLPSIAPGDMYEELGFMTVAICASRREAAYVNAVLATERITSFAHTYVAQVADEEEIVVPDEVHVMVESSMYAQARLRLANLQQELGKAWACPTCDTAIAAGHAICWRCGHHRPIAF